MLIVESGLSTDLDRMALISFDPPYIVFTHQIVTLLRIGINNLL